MASRTNGTLTPEGLAGVLLLLAVAACVDDEPTRPDTEVGARPARPAAPLQAIDVPAVRIDLPPAPRAWDTSDVALVQALAQGAGQGIVAFKEPGSRRSLETGLREAVSASTIRAATELLRGLGVGILYEYRSLGAVAVRVDPVIAPSLRRNPMVDFIEPRLWYQAQGSPMREAPVELVAQTTQITPWGISLVRAPEAWSRTTGTGARFELIDTGHWQGHEDLPLTKLLPARVRVRASPTTGHMSIWPHPSGR